MKKIFLLISVFAIMGIIANAGYSADQWVKQFNEITGLFDAFQQTTDGGYIVAGHTKSTANSQDFWVLKLDSDGNVGQNGTWQKTYGGSHEETVSSIQQTTDGGYIVAGSSNSFSAELSTDFLVLKLDSDGNLGPNGTWQKIYGLSSGGQKNVDVAESVQQTTDGGFILAGHTRFYDAGSGYNYDFCVLKLDEYGGITWAKTYGLTNSHDFARSILQAMDGGYIVAGYTFSLNDANYAIWILKLDSSGNITWQNTYDAWNGTGNDLGYATAEYIWQTTDGGYIVAGNTSSFGAGSHDFWVLKLTGSGDITWQYAYGGPVADTANAIQQITDGSYIVAGFTFDPFDFQPNPKKAFLIKVNGDGTAVNWANTYIRESPGYHFANAILQTQDEDYAIAGSTRFYNSNSSGWVLKLDATGQIPNCTKIIIEDYSNNLVISSPANVAQNPTGTIGQLASFQVLDTNIIPQNSLAEVKEVCPDTPSP